MVYGSGEKFKQAALPVGQYIWAMVWRFIIKDLVWSVAAAVGISASAIGRPDLEVKG